MIDYSRFKISAELPLLSLRISDDRVRGVLELVDSIPLPESRPAPRSSATSKVNTTRGSPPRPRSRDGAGGLVLHKVGREGSGQECRVLWGMIF